MYVIEFWGGPRDGDEVYQVVKPCEEYWTPTNPSYFVAEMVRTPVVESALLPIESHHYILDWTGELSGTFVYKGVVNKGMVIGEE